MSVSEIVDILDTTDSIGYRYIELSIAFIRQKSDNFHISIVLGFRVADNQRISILQHPVAHRVLRANKSV